MNNRIQHYYHHKAKGGLKTRLSKGEYRLCLDKLKLFSLWVVPTAEARREGKKAERINEVPAAEIDFYFDDDVQKIEVYDSGKLVATRQRGGFSK